MTIHGNQVGATTNSGFTLFELLVVVIIVAVLGGLAIPTWRYMVVNQQVRSASYELSSSLMFARNEATKRNALVRVKATGADWKDGWQVLDNANNVLQSQSAYTSVTFATNVSTSASCATPCLVFNRTGRVDSSTTKSDANAPYFKLTNAEGASTTIRCLVVDSSGRINSTVKSCG